MNHHSKTTCSLNPRFYISTPGDDIIDVWPQNANLPKRTFQSWFIPKPPEHKLEKLKSQQFKAKGKHHRSFACTCIFYHFLIAFPLQIENAKTLAHFSPLWQTENIQFFNTFSPLSFLKFVSVIPAIMNTKNVIIQYT